MKKVHFIFLTLIFVLEVALGAAVVAPVKQSARLSKPAVAVNAKKGKGLDDIFATAISTAKKNKALFEKLIKNIPTELDRQGGSFATTTKLAFIERDGNADVGFTFTFQEPGADSLSPFRGAAIEYSLSNVYPLFRNLFFQVLNRVVFEGTEIETVDPITKVQEKDFVSSPSIEFLLKVILLARDNKKGVINLSAFKNKLILLIAKLVKTPGLATFEDVLEQLPGPLTLLAKNIPIDGKPVLDYLNEMWGVVVQAVKYDFDKGPSKTLTIKDIKEIASFLTAVIFRMTIEYQEAIDLYRKSPIGQEAWEKYLQNKDQKTFDAGLPGAKNIKTNVATRLMNFITKFSEFKKIRNKVLSLLDPIVKPLLEPYGLSLAFLLPGGDDVIDSAASDTASQIDEMASLLNGDADMAAGDDSDQGQVGDVASDEGFTDDASAQADEQPAGDDATDNALDLSDQDDTATTDSNAELAALVDA
jgi:hypothetical protein